MLYKPGKLEGGQDFKCRSVKFVMQNAENPPKTREFSWQPFTSKRGFRQMLEDYVKQSDPQLRYTQNEHLASILKDKVKRVWQILEDGKGRPAFILSLHEFRKRRKSERNRKAMKMRLAQ
jgi:hypothetical protein